MSQDVFQMNMNQITYRLPGSIAIHDDICVFGKTRKEHLINVKGFMTDEPLVQLVINNSCSIH